VGSLAQTGQSRGIDLMAGETKQPADPLVTPTPVAAPMYQDESCHLKPLFDPRRHLPARRNRGSHDTEIRVVFRPV
jgi:hypothetical protein